MNAPARGETSHREDELADGGAPVFAPYLFTLATIDKYRCYRDRYRSVAAHSLNDTSQPLEPSRGWDCDRSSSEAIRTRAVR